MPRRPTPRALAAAATMLDQLERHHPGADTELDYSNAFELLVATILSAQCTDARVNLVTPVVFDRYPAPQALAAADSAALESIIQSTGFFRMKARSLIGMAQALVDEHDGQVPADMKALVKLPGVGRKTANVVLGHALGVPGFPVDRHVLRVATRLGLIDTGDAVKAEARLCTLWPEDRWTKASDTLILHGRRICKPRPLCDSCHARFECRYFKRLGAKRSPAKAAKKRASPRAARKTRR